MWGLLSLMTAAGLLNAPPDGSGIPSLLTIPDGDDDTFGEWGNEVGTSEVIC